MEGGPKLAIESWGQELFAEIPAFRRYVQVHNWTICLYTLQIFIFILQSRI